MLPHSQIIHFAKKAIICEECGAKKLCFNHILNTQQKQKFCTFITNSHAFSKDQHLFRTGSPTENLYILRSGSAKSYLVSENGDEQIIGFHFPGEVLGLDDLTNNQHASSVVFQEDANVCSMSTSSFNALANEIPQFQHETISRLNEEIAHAHELLLMINHLTAEQRVAAFILELSERMNLMGFSNTSIKLSMSRVDIANYLGLASDTVSRLLKTFERQGLILVKNKNLNIINFQELRSRANACDKCPSVLLNKHFSIN
jgi:CRP/FNR family transcriptional regulator